jgi:phosphoribosylformylglycinamidine (FGAM) synthase PurS component
MKAQNISANYHIQKETIKFETELDKKFHKIISAIRFGQRIDVPVMAKTEQDKKDVMKAIRKSALYNNIDMTNRWSKDFTYITLIVEGI